MARATPITATEAALTAYQVVRTTTEKLIHELNRPGPHELHSVTYMGGRDWVVITMSGRPAQTVAIKDDIADSIVAMLSKGPVVMTIDGQEVARAVGDNTEFKGVLGGGADDGVS
jgi:hypothetical protein